MFAVTARPPSFETARSPVRGERPDGYSTAEN